MRYLSSESKVWQLNADASRENIFGGSRKYGRTKTTAENIATGAGGYKATVCLF